MGRLELLSATHRTFNRDVGLVCNVVFLFVHKKATATDAGVVYRAGFVNDQLRLGDRS